MSENETYTKLKRKVDEFVKVFVYGEDLTNLEKVIELEYLSDKYEKRIVKKKYEISNDKTILTDNDCVKLVGKRDINIDFSRIEPDGYRTHINDIFRVYIF
jgi:hypothetical protein